MRLRRSELAKPGLRRRRCGRGFQYLDLEGRPTLDAEIRARISALAIPPAWQDVWICPWPNGHIQAIGTDAAGRRQYLYHAKWRQARDEEKHDRVLRLADKLPRFRQTVHADLTERGLGRHRVLAIALRLLDRGIFRTGGEEYPDENGGYGLATLLCEHIRVYRGVVICQFVGKSGIHQDIRIADAEIAKAVTALLRGRNGAERFLRYRSGKDWHDLHAADINDRLKELVGEEFTGKDLRTWNATVLAAVFLAEVGECPTTRQGIRRVEKRVLTEVAEQLGNTPAVAKKSYVDPRVLSLFEEGRTIAPALKGLTTPELTDDQVRARIERAVYNLITGADGWS